MSTPHDEWRATFRVTPARSDQDWSRSDLNLERFDTSERADVYDAAAGLSASEQMLVNRWVPRESRVLDVGVGTGRTYPALSGRASEYVGIDFAPTMIDMARARFPDGNFEVMDASDLSAFATSSFDVVVFSYNGLDYLHPFEKRSRALEEFHRVLAPGGTLILSCHHARAILRRPSRDWTDRKAAMRAVAIAAIGTARTTTSMVRSSAFWKGRGYVTDQVQGLLTYFVTPRLLLDELREHRFRPVDLLPGDAPREFGSWSTPWTYVAARAAADPGPDVETVESPGAWAAISGDWDALHRSNGDSFFQSRTWVEAWRKHLGPADEPIAFIATDRDSGRVVGLMTAAWQRRHLHRRVPIPLRYLGLAGAGPGAGDHLGPIAETDEVGGALIAAAQQHAGRRPLLLENLSPRWTSVARASALGKTVRRTECPVNVRVPTGKFSDSWSSKMRKNVRRRARQLDELDVVARWVPAGSEFADALSSLQKLHSRRWASEGGPGLFDDVRLAFLHDLAERSKPPDAPWILLLEQGERPVAGLLGFRSGDTFSVYKTGWDPEFARQSPGIALGAEAMRWAEEGGLTVFDYLRGPRGHKSDLGCQPVADTTVIAGSGPGTWLLSIRERLSADGVTPSWLEALRRLIR